MRKLLIFAAVLSIGIFSGICNAGEETESFSFERTKRMAEAGDAEMQYRLAKFYYSGRGAPSRNYSEAEIWWERAAKQGHAKAQYALGNMYNGKNKKQQIKALFWYQKAAEQGDATAQYVTGNMYKSGRGAAQNMEEAARWYRKAAEQGREDARKMLEWVTDFMRTEKSAEEGDAESQIKIAKIYASGFAFDKNLPEAEKWYRKAAEQGNAQGQFELGKYWFFPENGINKDIDEAGIWFNKAAQQGHEEAKKMAESIVFEKVKSRALDGDGESQFNLAEMYYTGNGVYKNHSQAFKWYNEAARQGHAKGQYGLGRMYYYGEGTQQNYDEAYRWFHAAADKGDEKSMEMLRVMEKPDIYK